VAFCGLMPWPVATISVWFAVTRAWLLSLVFHSAMNEGVVKNPTRGVRKRRLPPLRKLIRSNTLLVPWSAEAWTISTMCQVCVSSLVSGWFVAGNAGGEQLCDLPLAAGTLNDS